jgi:hypothetical protein
VLDAAIRAAVVLVSVPYSAELLSGWSPRPSRDRSCRNIVQTVTAHAAALSHQATWPVSNATASITANNSAATPVKNAWMCRSVGVMPSPDCGSDGNYTEDGDGSDRHIGSTSEPRQRFVQAAELRKWEEPGARFELATFALQD